MADDQRRRMRGKVFPIQGRFHPRPGARLLAPPGSWRPTVRWVCQGGSAGQQNQGRVRGRGFYSAAVAAIVSGGKHQRHRRLDAEGHGSGPVPVRGMARQPPAPRGCDKGCHCRPPPADPLLCRGELLARPQRDTSLLGGTLWGG
jgi:hypothetical protein